VGAFLAGQSDAKNFFAIASIGNIGEFILTGI
jgi:hypothetical protein